MKVFFVRHAHSLLNGKGFHQHSTTPLSKVGLKQATAVARRISHMDIDAIICSNYTRARQTARLISKATHKRVHYTPLLNERKHPSSVEGLRFEDPIAVNVMNLIYSHASEPNWHYSDEENFAEFKKRCMTFIHQIEVMHKRSVIVVTHSGTMRMLIACMLFGTDLTPDLYSKVNHFLSMVNTGITACGNDFEGRWQLLVWNDHAHRPDYLVDGKKLRKKRAS